MNNWKISVESGAAPLFGLVLGTVLSACPATAQQAPDASGDIVMTAVRQRGAVEGAISPEATLDANAVRALGASTIADLIAQLSAQTTGGQGRAGEAPVLLLNGRRISSFAEVRDLPPEAVARVDVLPEEAAIRYGYPAHQKVINIVLLPHFAAVTGEVEDRVASATGRNDFNTEFGAVKIDGENRMTLDLQYQVGDSVLEAQRGIIRTPGSPPATFGGTVSGVGGSQIDPALSALVGRQIQMAPLPPSTAGSVPTLADFAAAATTDLRDDSGWQRTLVPATRQFTANAVFARTLTPDISLTVNGRYDRLTGDALLGPTAVSLLVPAGNLYSPFGSGVQVDRYLDPALVIARETVADTAHLGSMLSGYWRRWQWSLAGTFDRTLTRTRTTGGVDASSFENAVLSGDPSANPFGPLDPGQFASLAPSTTRGLVSSLVGDANASGPLFALPAGDAILTLHASAGADRMSAQSQSDAPTMLRRDMRGGQISADLPLIDPRSPIGGLSASLSFFAHDYSGIGTLTDRGWTLIWSPLPVLSLVVAGNHETAVPTANQLGDPVISTPDAVFYDYGSAQSVSATRIDGGAPSLTADRRRLFKTEATLKPVKNLSMIATYTDISTANPIIAFPGVTPAFEAAFPDRIVRTADGTLSQVDARPLNLASEHRQELRWGFNFSHNFTAPAGLRVPGGGGFGGNHYFGAKGSMVQFAVYHSWRLIDEVVLVPGTPAIDLIGSNQLGDTMLVPRHSVDAQLSATHAGFGLRASATWRSTSDVATGTAGSLRISQPVTLNLRLFAFPAQQERLAARWPWVRNVRLMFVVDNVLDTYSRVVDQTGATPLAYQRGYRDPLGRTFRLSLRKTFE